MASFPQDLPAGASLSPPSVALSEPGWFKKIFLTKRFLFFSILGHLLLGQVGDALLAANKDHEAAPFYQTLLDAFPKNDADRSI